MGFVSDVLGGVADAVGGVVDGVVNIVEDIGSSIDDMVHDIIPGGWAGVGALGLLAVGIADPTLLGLAEEGALTTEALTSAGVDAAKVAEAVSAVTPEVTAATAAATSSGIAPEIIAAANATTDPIAALNALTGATTADTAYLATIGATPEIIAAAEANNAAIAAKAGETAAATGGTETATTGGTTGATEGGTTQVFDDGSTLTTNADGTISATDTAGNPTQTLVSPGGPGQAPVYDASGTAVPGTNNPYGNGDIPLGTAMGDYAKAVYDTLGPLGTAGLLGAGALASGLVGGGTATGPSGGTASYEWGQAQPLVNPGLNPGYIGYAASMPDYQTTSPTQSQYYWGVHAPVNSAQDLANYNKLPDYAPETPWGMANSAVGGTAQMNVPNFVNQYITNPAWAGVNAGTSPGYTPPEPQSIPMGPAAPLTGNFQPANLQPAPLSMAQQAMASMSGAPTAQLTAGPAVPA